MIYRNSNGDLIEINKYEYITDQEYMRYVLGIKNIDFLPNANANACNTTNSYIQTFLLENSIKNIDNKDKNDKR